MQKKQLGAKTFIYPMPVVIVGANIEGKPNFNTIAYCEVAQSKPPMIALWIRNVIQIRELNKIILSA
jgi:flavin reductase (DIM6/NTAB) family NADH-FMN oxidoreductase RutF